MKAPKNLPRAPLTTTLLDNSIQRLSEISKTFKDNARKAVTPNWFQPQIQGWEDKLKEVFKSEDISDSDGTYKALAVAQLTQKTVAEPGLDHVSHSKFSDLINPKKLIDPETLTHLNHRYYSSSVNRTETRLCAHLNLFNQCCLLISQFEDLKKLLALYFDNTLQQDDDFPSPPTAQHQELFTKRIRIQTLAEKYAAHDRATPSALSPIKMQQLENDLRTLTQAPQSFEKLQETYEQSANEIFKKDLIALIFSFFNTKGQAESEVNADSLREIETIFTTVADCKLPEISIPEKIAESKQNLETHLSQCKALTPSEESKALLSATNASTPNKIEAVRKLTLYFEKTESELLEAPCPINLIALVKYAIDSIDPTSQGTNAIDYRHSVTLLGFLKSLCENYNHSWHQFTLVLQNQYFERFVFTGKTPEEKHLLTDTDLTVFNGLFNDWQQRVRKDYFDRDNEGNYLDISPQ